MANAPEIRQQVQEFLDGRMSLEDFADWSAKSSWNVHKVEDEEAQRLAYLIRSLLNERPDGEHEQIFRAELASAIPPFALRSVEVSGVEQVSSGELAVVSTESAARILEGVKEMRRLLHQANEWATEASQAGELVPMPIKRETAPSVPAKTTYGSSVTLWPELVAERG